MTGPSGSTGPAWAVGPTGSTGTLGPTGPISPGFSNIPAINILLSNVHQSGGSISTRLSATNPSIYPYDVLWVSNNTTLFFTDVINSSIKYSYPGDAAGSLIASGFVVPSALAFYPVTNTLYVTNSGTNQILSAALTFGSTSITGTFGVYAGISGGGFSNASRLTSKFLNPTGMAIASDNTLYVADTGNFAIRKIDPTGTVTTVAGSGASGFVDGIGAYASFIKPTFICLDIPQTYLYVSDATAIRRIDLRTTNVVTIAGSATGSSNVIDGIGSAARFSNAAGIKVDGTDTVYVVDAGTWSLRKIQYLNSVYAVTTMAGSDSLTTDPGLVYSGSNIQTATFNTPRGLSIDTNSTLYVADTQHNAIRTITASTCIITKLNVNTLSVNTILTPSAATSVVFSDPSGTYYTSDSAFTYDALTKVLTINGITQSSDSRFKKNIVPLSNGLSSVLALNPVYYTMVNSDQKRIGFLAQDVEAVLPELVHTDTSAEQKKSIEYANLTAVLVDSVKELNAQVVSLQSTVRGLQREA
jgi:sugar lactone lactonase YvrE